MRLNFSQSLMYGCLLIIRLYQKIISPLLPARCRYYPTCSNYAIHALRLYGFRGINLTIHRLARCHPFGGSGVDFVPICLANCLYEASSHYYSSVFRDRFSYKTKLGKTIKWQGRLKN